ncbi:MAG: hypothetical protein DKM50_02310 [Candidatus Margulisiibacteriota bacterium]|nr:MAG: hypothetical protein A2X43_06765 [Candidatus Margulisbacteria bacterium GWD2_39_127]OGI05280.1 MAG: hypothetical protein A2X42_03720 [Candidatus Margulisbacteria bacterium GWF2_38_17]OGI10861.1 MAG: hypothetical protein A2X41_05755 [Candidatus Margulisbacteria bacterium GWE2_39_32]PZM83549.1 MAG: hypothetical protein DKM50_02310 [Candidatus Margulisiibacteriota bacterium]HAR64273.1 hypothetical protein [Candidatus Margulisiibacteriota bacterium]
MRKWILTTLCVICLAGSVQAESKITQIMNSIDELQDIKTDITAKVKMTQQKVTQGIKATEMIYYRRDKDDSFLILMTGPESEKGNGYLKSGDNFWMYRRNTRTFQHINRDESIGGSDASADDFEKRKLVDLYKPALDGKGLESIVEEVLGTIPVYKIKLIAKVSDVKYPSLTYWVRKDNLLPLKEQSYSLSGTLMETAYYRKYTLIDGKYVFIQAMFIDEFEKGNKTMVEISGISTKKVEDSVFTKAYLENISK